MGDTRGVNNSDNVSTQYSIPETTQGKVSQTEQEGKFEGRNIKVVDSEKNNNFLTKFFNNVGNFFKSLFGFNKESTVLTPTKINPPVVSSTKWTPAEKKFTRLSDPPSTSGVTIGNKSIIKDEPASVISQPSESIDYQDNAHLDSKSEISHSQVEEPLQEVLSDQSSQIIKDQSDISLKDEEKASHLEIEESQKQSDKFTEINEPEVSHVVSKASQALLAPDKPDVSLEPPFPEQTPAAQPPLVEKDIQLNQNTQENPSDALPTVKNAPLPTVDSSKISTDEKITQNKPVRANAVADRIKNLQQGYLAKEKAEDKEKVMKANDQLRNPVLRETPLRPPSPSISSSSTPKVETNIKSDKTNAATSTASVQSVTAKKTNSVKEIGLSIDNRVWSSTTSLTRSKDGAQGVLFFMDKNGDRLVLKTEVSLQQQTFATRFLQARGFNCPPIVLVQTQSEEGQKISQVISNSKINKGNVEQENLVKAFGKKVLSKDVIMVMPYIDGRPMQDISPQNASDVKLIKQDQFSKNIGKLYIYDCLLGNKDRFNFTAGFNAGNIMVNSQGDLIPIDQDVDSSDLLTKSFQEAVLEVSKGQTIIAEKIKSIVEKGFKPPQKKTGLAALRALEKDGNQVSGINKPESFLKTDLILQGMNEGLQEISAQANTIGDEARTISENIRKEANSTASDLEVKNRKGISMIDAIEQRTKMAFEILNKGGV